VRALGRSLAAASIATSCLLGLAGATAAECDGPPPPFAETVASATQIVIGNVVAIGPMDDPAHGRSSRFTFEVTHTVRGESVARLEVKDLELQPCWGNVVVGMGDRIALALNATAFTPAIPVNGVAWIDGPPPEGLETTTVEEVYKLAGVPMPPPTAAPDVAAHPDSTPFWLGPLMWGLGVAAVLVVVAVVGRRVGAAR
jgi:hypothetical protein